MFRTEGLFQSSLYLTTSGVLVRLSPTFPSRAVESCCNEVDTLQIVLSATSLLKSAANIVFNVLSIQRMINPSSRHSKWLGSPWFPSSKLIRFVGRSLKMAFQTKSTLDRGTRFRENTRNRCFRMILNWFIYFGVFLDRENRYTTLSQMKL